MTNEDVLNDMLRKTFPKVILIREVNERNKTQTIHIAEEWLNAEYEPQESGGNMAEINFEKVAQNVVQGLKDNGVFIGRWIPVSDGLPEKEGRYLTTIFNVVTYIMVCDYHPYSRCWCPDDECASDNVIAWMPLPESYGAESEGTK